MVGAPGSIEMRSATTRCITVSTSKTAWGTIVVPVIRHARMPAFKPNVWKNGLTMR